MDRSKLTKTLVLTVIIGGMICLSSAFFRLDILRIDIPLIALFVFTVAIGSRITIKIPRFKSYISASETFVFLTLLIYGGEFAVILAAAEAFVTSWRVCKKKLTVVYNTANIAISTSMVVVVLKIAGLYTESQLHGHIDNRQSFVIALSAIALSQFLVNTSLASVYNSLRDNAPVWETWKSKYIWSFFTYFVGAVAAGLLIQLANSFGVGMIVATFPVGFFVFSSYRMYLKNIEISMHQAEQAGQYAKILEAQSDKLRESEERFRSAFDYAPIGIGLVASTGEWLKVNFAMSEILGYSEEEFLQMDFQSITIPDDLGITLVKVHEVISGRLANCQMEQRYKHKSGRTVWASWSLSAACDSKSSRPNLIFQIQDITDKKVAEQQLQHDASHDALTGLPNRLFFMNRLAESLAKLHERRGYKVSILFIDLDRFKYVNDSLGHVIGDQLLKGIAERLRECMRPSDIVARLGGDEFTILVEGEYDPAEVTRIAERIHHKFSIPFDLFGHEVYSSASIGILHSSTQHLSPEDMMRDADTAMYQAKRAGKARHEIFDEKMHRAAKETLQLETDLRRAVEREEISVEYQPIYCLTTGHLDGFESLARWHHPTVGAISPDKFIPLAEEIGLIDKLCEQVLRRACRDIGSLHDRHSPDPQLSLSVNLSCRQFAQSTLVQNICGILDETAFSPHWLKLEITESVFFEHTEKAVEMLKKLRDIGIDINIDDFGTGYSNLSYLMKLPISTLKIDQSFIAMIDDAGNNDEIVRAIITLARNLGLKVIAEGIETEKQVEKLKTLKCEGGQGYYFAAPMTFAELRSFLSTTEGLVIPSGRFDNISTILAVQ